MRVSSYQWRIVEVYPGQLTTVSVALSSERRVSLAIQYFDRVSLFLNVFMSLIILIKVNGNWNYTFSYNNNEVQCRLYSTLLTLPYFINNYHAAYKFTSRATMHGPKKNLWMVIHAQHLRHYYY